jgi:hypothetical protein
VNGHRQGRAGSTAGLGGFLVIASFPFAGTLDPFTRPSEARGSLPQRLQ